MEGKCIFIYLSVLQLVGAYLITILMKLISVRVWSFETGLTNIAASSLVFQMSRLNFARNRSFTTCKSKLKEVGKSCIIFQNLKNNFTPFHPKEPFLSPLKTSVNLMVCWCSLGVEKECIRNKWVKKWLES